MISFGGVQKISKKSMHIAMHILDTNSGAIFLILITPNIFELNVLTHRIRPDLILCHRMCLVRAKLVLWSWLPHGHWKRQPSQTFNVVIHPTHGIVPYKPDRQPRTACFES